MVSRDKTKLLISNGLTQQIIIVVTGVIALGSLLSACRSTNPVVKVNKQDDKITLYSSDERDSSLASASDHRSIQNAIEVLQERLKKNPRDIPALLDLSRLYLMKKDLTVARKLCQKALAYDIHSRRGSKLLAEIEYAQGNTDRAEIILLRLVSNLDKDKTQDDEIENLLGLIAGKKGNYDEALVHFQKGLKANPENAAIRMNLGTLHLKYKQVLPAEKQFEQVLKSLPDHTDAKLHLAIAKAYKRDDKLAMTMYKEVLDKDSGNYLALYNLALVQRRNNETEDALKNLKKAITARNIPEKRKDVVKRELEDLQLEVRKRQEEEKRKKQEGEAAKSLAAKKLKENEKRKEGK